MISLTRQIFTLVQQFLWWCKTRELSAVQILATIMEIMFWDFLILYQIFISPQVKRSAIISNKQGVYELPHELLNKF